MFARNLVIGKMCVYHTQRSTERQVIGPTEHEQVAHESNCVPVTNITISGEILPQTNYHCQKYTSTVSL
jgi:hypothetical protein